MDTRIYNKHPPALNTCYMDGKIADPLLYGVLGGVVGTLGSNSIQLAHIFLATKIAGSAFQALLETETISRALGYNRCVTVQLIAQNALNYAMLCGLTNKDLIDQKQALMMHGIFALKIIKDSSILYKVNFENNVIGG